LKTIKFKKIHELAVLPSKKNNDDAGYDLTSIENAVIPARAQQNFKTGIELADCPKDVVLQLWSRSGLDAKFALHVGAGVVDAGYRGEIIVNLKNMNNMDYEVKVGDKIAQLLPVTLAKVGVEEVNEVTASSRGKTGGITEFKSQEITFHDEMPE
jgi:dUTP pyrophosphatase